MVQQDNADDQAVDTDDTGKDDRDDSLHDQLGLHDTHAGDADGRLGSTIGTTDDCERDDRVKKQFKERASPPTTQ